MPLFGLDIPLSSGVTCAADRRSAESADFGQDILQTRPAVTACYRVLLP